MMSRPISGRAVAQQLAQDAERGPLMPALPRGSMSAWQMSTMQVDDA